MMMATSGNVPRHIGPLLVPSFAALAAIVSMSAGVSSARGDADNLGHVRHLVVAPDGTLYANTWSGRYFANAPPPPGGFLLALKDTRGEGRADVVQRFGVTVEAGGTGGSGIALYHDALFAEEN
jgi:hypothetical protein